MMGDLVAWFSDAKHLFDAISFVLGLLYLMLEFRASVWLWPVGIVMPIVHSITYYKAGLYVYKGIPFSAALYGFYTVMAVLGYRNWLRLMQRQD